MRRYFLRKEKRMYYIGVDLGTSAVKLLLMDGAGKIRNVVSREYPLRFPQPGAPVRSTAFFEGSSNIPSAAGSGRRVQRSSLRGLCDVYSSRLPSGRRRSRVRVAALREASASALAMNCLSSSNPFIPWFHLSQIPPAGSAH